MTYEEARINLENLIVEMSDDDLIEIYNCYCRHNDKDGSQIYNMSDLDDELYEYSPTDIINIVDSNFDTYDDFFMFNKRGRLISFSYLDSYIDIDDIVDFILDDEDDLYNREIEAILKQLEHTETEDDGTGLEFDY